MKGSGVGGNSCLYRAFLVLGFVGIVGATVVTAVTQPGDSKLPIYVGVGGVSIFLILIVAYWVVQIVFRGYGSMRAADPAQKLDPENLAVLQNWDSLFNAMITAPGDAASMQRAARRGNSSLVMWFLTGAVVALCPIGFMVPYLLGILPWSYIGYPIGLYIVIVFLMLLLSIFTLLTSTKAGQEVVLAPLGLSIVGMPDVFILAGSAQVRGATELAGTRFGRAVKISLHIGGVTTHVAYNSPAFELKSRSGNLEAEDGAPQTVSDALRGLSAAGRWQGVTARGARDGISVERTGQGQNLWLYDLWLIERIINSIDGKAGK